MSKSTLKGMNFILTMGDNKVRTELSNQIISLGGEVPSLIHPTAVISRFVKISPIGVYISPITYVQADSSIGDNTVLLSHVNISNTTNIGSSCFIAGGATIVAYTYNGGFCFCGSGRLSISAKSKYIGNQAYICARNLLTRDIPANVVVVGNPCKVIRHINKVLFSEKQ